MATAELIAELRRLTAEPTPTTYDDVLLGSMLDAQGTNLAAAQIWDEKAASVAHLVNVSEGGSSRSMSDLYKAFSDIADRFRRYAEEADAALLAAPRTRAIERG